MKSGNVLNLFCEISRGDPGRVYQAGNSVLDDAPEKDRHRFKYYLEKFPGAKTGDLSSLPQEAKGLFRALPHRSCELFFSPEMQREISCLVEEIMSRQTLLDRGIEPARCLLFHGPPGTGKTSLATHLADRLRRLSLAVNTEQLFDSHFGVSSRNVVAMFNGSANLSPAIILLDECDSIVCRRTSGESGASQEANRMANTLLQALDEDRTNHIWVLATNRPGVIDSAFHRRINRAIHFPLPTQEVIRGMLVAWWLETDWARLDDPTLSALSLSAHGLSHAEVRDAFNQVRKDSVLGRLVGQDEAQALLGALEKRKTITHGK